MSYVQGSRAVILAFVATLLPAQAAAAEMALAFKDGSVTIRGEFLGFDGANYLVETQQGEIYVPAQFVNCAGDDCIAIVQVSNNDG